MVDGLWPSFFAATSFARAKSGVLEAADREDGRRSDGRMDGRPRGAQLLKGRKEGRTAEPWREEGGREDWDGS